MHKTERYPKLKGMTMKSGALESHKDREDALMGGTLGSMSEAFEEPIALKQIKH